MPNIRIFEPIYAKGQQLNEDSFLPLKIENDRADWRELASIIEVYRRGLHKGEGVTGVFSPKFALKSGISGTDLIGLISNAGPHDVYLANPGPNGGYLHYNVWENGEAFHPGVLARSQAVLDAVGINWDLSDQPRHGFDVLLYCNFWVGTEAFWEDYVGRTLLPIAVLLETQPTHPAAIGIMEEAPYHVSAPYLPFMIERLFTTYLKQSTGWSSWCWHRDPIECCITPFERAGVEFMLPLVQQADRTGFTDEMRRLMRFIGYTDDLYKQEYFSNNRHPHLS